MNPVMKNPIRELPDTAEEVSQHLEIERKTAEKGLTQMQKRILGETKLRHDKALRRLAQM